MPHGNRKLTILGLSRATLLWCTLQRSGRLQETALSRCSFSMSLDRQPCAEIEFYLSSRSDLTPVIQVALKNKFDLNASKNVKYEKPLTANFSC